jgi:radical SAM superfamily enzyme YgiQ (UPF0313 family)
MRPIRAALGDLSYVSEADRFNLYVPLNVGFLASYARRLYGRDVEVTLFKDPVELLDHVRITRPDIVGLALYYWNSELNRVAMRKIRAIAGYRPVIVLGGPSIDTDPAEQARLLARYPEADAVVPDEGEDGFANILGGMLEGTLFTKPLDGVVFRDGDTLVRGKPIGLATDLAQVPSPYLEGLLDRFLDGPFQPMIQTSRLCPYTCSFCVSGKNRGKLRAFDLAQVREEILFIGRHFNDRPDHRLYITDENFGILQRDIEVAHFILEAREVTGYPQKIFYYNDKRFTQLSRDLQELLGHMCFHGVTLSLQSENPETLKAIKRRNLTDDELVSAIGWAGGLGLPVATELIFGLPMETRESFIGLLDKCLRLGFDALHCYNLIIFDGIEMNRQDYRDKHQLVTRHRLMAGSAQWLDGEFCLQSEEVVVSTTSFDFDDFQLVRGMNLLFFTISFYKLHEWFFKYLVSEKIPVGRLLSEFLRPTEGDDPVAASHRAFLDELGRAIVGELFTDRAAVEEFAAAVKAGTAVVPEQIKINPAFGKRLIGQDFDWATKIFARLLPRFTDDPAVIETGRHLLDLGRAERVDLAKWGEAPPVFRTRFDLLGWQRAKYQTRLSDHDGAARLLSFAMKPTLEQYRTRGADASEVLKAMSDFLISPLDLIYEVEAVPDPIVAGRAVAGNSWKDWQARLVVTGAVVANDVGGYIETVLQTLGFA